MQSPADWHPEDVKAAIRKTGTTMEALGLSAGFSRVVVGIALRRPMPRIEALIARHLGVEPQTIWPSRYDAAGRPLKGLHAGVRSNRSAPAPTPHRQKSEAA